MPIEARLLRLLTWMYPAFPSGARAHVEALRAAVLADDVRDEASLTAWIAELFEAGAVWSECRTIEAAWTASTAEDEGRLEEIAARSLLEPGARLESLADGQAYLRAVAGWNPPPVAGAPYPVAVGATAGAAGMPLQPALTGWLHGCAAAMLDAVKGPLGLTPAASIDLLVRLEPVILSVAARACEREPTGRAAPERASGAAA